MRLIGVDENGYGPLLGPLLVTAARARTDRHRPAPDLWEALEIGRRPGPGPFICDSKLVFGAGTSRAERGEEMVLALLLARTGELADSADRFLELVLANAELDLEFPCRAGGLRPVCWEENFKLELAGDRRRRIEQLARRFEASGRAAGLELEIPRAALFCPRLFNERCGPAAKSNKSELVIRTGLSLSGRGRETELAAVLGKVGGRHYYARHLSENFPGCRVETLQEEPGISAYQLRDGERLHRFTYLADGESRDFLVAAASLFGKYSREIFWKKTVRFFAARASEPLPPASGYRDGITRRFVAATAGIRKRLGIPEDCFLRLR